MRKLASVQTIQDVQPIEGADRIEVVSVLGWKCVAKKGEFKKYDLCVYFEVDAFLPVKPEFEFLRDGCYRSNDLNMLIRKSVKKNANTWSIFQHFSQYKAF